MSLPTLAVPPGLPLLSLALAKPAAPLVEEDDYDALE